MDSINGAIFCKEQSLFEEYFSKKEHYQIFYNKGTRCVIFRQKKNIFQISVDSQSISKMEIPYEGPIYDMQIHKKERYVAYSIAHNLLSIVYIGKEGKESRLKISKDDKMDPIIHYEWIYGCQRSIDFVLCKQSGLVLYKLDQDKHQLKEQKIIPIDISACWFDPTNEILCCANNYEEGKIVPFYFNEKRQGFKYKGTEFKVESSKKDIGNDKVKGQSSSVMNFFAKQINKLQSKFDIVNFVTIGDNRNKDLTLIPRDPDVCHKISLVVLYGKTFLVYMNPFHNKIFLYQLSFEKVTLCEFNIVSPSETGIRFSVADNLLIIHSTTENLSLVYDIRSRTSAYQIGPPQCLEIRQDHNQSRKSTVILEMLKSKNEQEDDEEDEEEQNDRQVSSNYSDPRFSTQSTIQSEQQQQQQVYRHSENPDLTQPSSHHKSGRKQSSAAAKAAKHPSANRQSIPVDIRGANLSVYQNPQANLLEIQHQNNNINSIANKNFGIFDDINIPSQGDLMNKSVEINVIDPEVKANDEQHFEILHHYKKQSLLEEDVGIIEEQIAQQQQKEQQFEIQQSEYNIIENPNNISDIPNNTNNTQQQNDTLISDLNLLNLNTVNPQNITESNEKAWDSLFAGDQQYKQNNFNIFDQTATQEQSTLSQQQNIEPQPQQNKDPLDLLDDDFHHNEREKTENNILNQQAITSHKIEQNSTSKELQSDSLVEGVQPQFINKPENYLKIENKGQIYQLDKNIFTQDEFIINCKERKFHTINVDINRIEKLATDEIEGFNVIIRRANSKEYGLHHLRQLFLKRKDIRYFGQIFNQILSNYKKKMISKSKSKAYEAIDTGDIYYLFFLHLYTNSQTNKSYLTDVLSEYTKQSTELEIPVESKYQNLLAKLLIEQQKFNTFLFYVQYRIITDNEDLALILINMNTTQHFKQGFQLGLDMLFRLKKYYTIINILLKRGLFQQALDFMRKNTVNKINLKEMVKVFLNQKGDMNIDSIIEYFKEIISKSSKNEKFGFTYLEFVDELQVQQQQIKQSLINQQIDLI